MYYLHAQRDRIGHSGFKEAVREQAPQVGPEQPQAQLVTRSSGTGGDSSRAERIVVGAEHGASEGGTVSILVQENS